MMRRGQKDEESSVILKISNMNNRSGDAFYSQNQGILRA